MRRKLIKQDVFDKIVNQSVTTAGKELSEASAILAKALGKDHISLRSFDGGTALFETLDNTYVHAGYEIKNGQITFQNIEELVIDESTRKEKKREILSQMIDCVLEDKDTKAQDLFRDYLGMVSWNEVKDNDCDEEEDHKDKKGFPFKKGKHKKEDKKNFFLKKSKDAGKDMHEAYAVAQNVLDYVNFMKVGPTLAESVVKTDEKGNVTDLRIPALRQRNESHLVRFDWKTLNAKVADCRKKIASIAENQNFCKEVSKLRQQNSFSNPEGLEVSLTSIVKQWPDVLFVTEAELTEIVKESLQLAGVKDYDDETCEFMAEGILRKAHGVYTEKVNQILHLASAPKCEENVDAYEFFQNVVGNFYPTLDQKFGLERKVFSDLYESLAIVYKKADRQGDNALKSEAASYINELADVLNGEIRPQLEVAEEAAEFLGKVIETNLESGKWVVSNTPHMTVSGDHPDMAKKASHGYAPSKDFSGNWGDEAPTIGSDSMEYKSGKHSKKMRNDSWGQAGTKGDVFPGVKNPYLPKPFGDYTMKGEKGVDKDNTNFGMFKSDDTWPNLKNPYVPKEAGKSYKMKNGEGTDLVVDK